MWSKYYTAQCPAHLRQAVGAVSAGEVGLVAAEEGIPAGGEQDRLQGVAQGQQGRGVVQHQVSRPRLRKQTNYGFKLLADKCNLMKYCLDLKTKVQEFLEKDP